MSAQMLRLNTVASNLANARSVASSEAEAYRADDSIDSFRGWWTDEPGIASYADTPFEVCIDLLDSEP